MRKILILFPFDIYDIYDDISENTLHVVGFYLER